MSAVDVLHMSKVVSRAGYTKTTTLCGRSKVMDDGMNITVYPQVVTCKLCRARLDRAGGAK